MPRPECKQALQLRPSLAHLDKEKEQSAAAKKKKGAAAEMEEEEQKAPELMQLTVQVRWARSACRPCPAPQHARQFPASPGAKPTRRR